VQENRGFRASRSALLGMGQWLLESGPSVLTKAQGPSFSCISCSPSSVRSGCGLAGTAGLRSATAALRSGAGVGVVGRAPLPRLRWRSSCHPVGDGARPQVSSRGCAASWSFNAKSGGLAYQLSSPPMYGLGLCRSIAPQPLCLLQGAFVLIE